jgi:aldose 1-epimerase
MTAATLTGASAASAVRAPFGALPGGGLVEAVTLARGGVTVRIITLGAAIQALHAADRNGDVVDVALGFADPAGYVAAGGYVGVSVGRVANRIAGGRFTLDGRDYLVPVNNGPNALHGGESGFDKANWEIVSLVESARPAVALRHVSPHLDQGFPGTLTATVTYALDEEGVLALTYEATTDRPTLVNLTSHAYWNLAGEGAAEGAMGHLLTVPAEHYLPTDATAIPTGEIRAVAGTAFDFRVATPVGARIRDAAEQQLVWGKGYDHNWVVARAPAPAPRLVARVEEPRSGRVLELFSDQPGLQFYSGNFLDGTVAGKAGRLYRQGDALVLEPQMFPDTPNRPEFGSLRLAPGETYRHRLAYRFGVARPS